MFKGGLEFAEGIVGSRKSVSLSMLSECIYFHELFSDIPYGFLCLFFNQMPCPASQLIQPGVHLIRPDILLEDTDPVGRDIETVFFGVFYDDKIIDLLLDLHFTETAVTADPMILVDDQIIDLEKAQARPVQPFCLNASLCFGPGPFGPENLIFADDVNTHVRP